MQKTLMAILLTAVVVGGGSFWGGIKYGQSAKSAAGRGGFANLSSEERQQRLQELGAGVGGFRGGRGGGQGGSGFTSGEVISKDDKSVTIKLRDGGSKIVFLSGSTEVSRFVEGTLSDLEIGKNISVDGTVNSDGSVTAQTVQLRPVPNRAQ